MEEQQLDIPDDVVDMVLEDFEEDIIIRTIDLSEPGIVDISYYDRTKQAEYVQSAEGISLSLHTHDLAEGFLQITSVARLMIRDAQIEIRDHINKNVGR